MQLPDDHPLFRCESKVNLVCKPLFNCLEIHEFTYLKIFKNASFIHFDTHSDFANDYYKLDIHPDLAELEKNERQYVILSPNINQPYLTYHEEKLKTNINLGIKHGIYHRLYIIKNKPTYFEIIGFGTYNENINMIDYLLMNIETFNRFLLFFKNEFYHELSKSSHNNIKLLNFDTYNNNIKDYKNDNKLTSFANETSLKNFMLNNQKVSFREIQCLNYLAHGLTIKGISRCIDLTPKTVEAHIYNLKNKLNCHTKSELIDIYYSSDLSDVENMF